MRNLLLMTMLLAMGSGCKDTAAPQDAELPPVAVPTDSATEMATPETTATTARASEPTGLRGGWTVHLRSEAPGLNPDLFDTPEKRAKVFFDHRASVKEGRIQVEHKTLSKTWPMKDGAPSFDALLAKTDWGTLATNLAAEKGSEGGTVFLFTITRGETKHELKTAELDAHPPLLEIVKALKATTGVP
jgi:hypothetical protein